MTTCPHSPCKRGGCIKCPVTPVSTKFSFEIVGREVNKVVSRGYWCARRHIHPARVVAVEDWPTKHYCKLLYLIGVDVLAAFGDFVRKVL